MAQKNCTGLGVAPGKIYSRSYVTFGVYAETVATDNQPESGVNFNVAGTDQTHLPNQSTAQARQIELKLVEAGVGGQDAAEIAQVASEAGLMAEWADRLIARSQQPDITSPIGFIIHVGRQAQEPGQYRPAGSRYMDNCPKDNFAEKFIPNEEDKASNRRPYFKPKATPNPTNGPIDFSKYAPGGKYGNLAQSQPSMHLDQIEPVQKVFVPAQPHEQSDACDASVDGVAPIDNLSQSVETALETTDLGNQGFAPTETVASQVNEEVTPISLPVWDTPTDFSSRRLTVLETNPTDFSVVRVLQWLDRELELKIGRTWLEQAGQTLVIVFRVSQNRDIVIQRAKMAHRHF